MKTKMYDTPVKAIRKKCLDCCCSSHKEISQCTVIKCAICLYRFGRRPNKVTVDTLKKFYDEKA